MDALGITLAIQHRYPEALDRQTLALHTKLFTAHHPDTSQSEFFLAQVLALQGKRDEALTHLQLWLDDGPTPSVIKNFISDDSFNSLHGDPRFAAIVTDAKERAAAAQKSH
jgi:hypothetical protein